ncbi:hypothetical protein VSR17_20850 [Cupriavidus taiwanensis]|uniref:hypothetical protein n=1 Tax=Cupriavidus taiwanensis TaxID=164546 RepID=UPI000E1714FC|nr:hypothetical protein [Cupriavidus taiwanensis]SPA26894.1 conserved hypothetical protein [Cupriavidus taiwanensis]
MTAVIQPPTWNSPADAVSSLAPLLDSSSVVKNLLVKLDPMNVHHDGGPAYRQARYAYGYTGAEPGGPKGAVWLDAHTGLRLYHVVGWQMAE